MIRCADDVEAARAAQGRRLVVVDPGETPDDLAPDGIEGCTAFCARRNGRRSAQPRAERALRRAAEDGAPWRSPRPSGTSWTRPGDSGGAWPRRRARPGTPTRGAWPCASAGSPSASPYPPQPNCTVSGTRRSPSGRGGPPSPSAAARRRCATWIAPSATAGGRTEGHRVGFPRVRRQHRRRDSWRLTGSLTVHPRSVGLPRLGGVRVKEPTAKFRGRILSATVCREANRWYVSWAVEVERDDPQPADGPVGGIDLGLQSFGVLSDGTRVQSLKPLANARRRLRHRQRLHSRRQRGSCNRRKSAAGLWPACTGASVAGGRTSCTN